MRCVVRVRGRDEAVLKGERKLHDLNFDVILLGIKFLTPYFWSPRGLVIFIGIINVFSSSTVSLLVFLLLYTVPVLWYCHLLWIFLLF